MKDAKQMTAEEIRAEIAEIERKHPRYNGAAKWAMRLFALRYELGEREPLLPGLKRHSGTRGVA